MKPKAVKPFDLFISGSVGVGKSHLIKTICQSVITLLQYHCRSPEKPRVLILAPTGVASINVNSTTVHSALCLPYRGKLFPLDSNTLAALRIKYAEVEQSNFDEISMVYASSLNAHNPESDIPMIYGECLVLQKRQRSCCKGETSILQIS